MYRSDFVVLFGLIIIIKRKRPYGARVAFTRKGLPPEKMTHPFLLQLYPNLFFIHEYACPLPLKSAIAESKTRTIVVASLHGRSALHGRLYLGSS